MGYPGPALTWMPGATVEDKASAIVWHYRDCDEDTLKIFEVTACMFFIVCSVLTHIDNHILYQYSCRVYLVEIISLSLYTLHTLLKKSKGALL